MPSWKSDFKIWLNAEKLILILNDKVSLLDLMDNFNLEYTTANSGEFTHKAKCPMPIHLAGNENTASMYISDTQNKFYCFGCLSKGDSIDFLSLYLGMPFHESIRWLIKFSNISQQSIANFSFSKKVFISPEETVFHYIFKSGVLIRGHLNSLLKSGDERYQKWETWANRAFLKLDKMMDELPDSKWQVAKLAFDKITKTLEENK